MPDISNVLVIGGSGSVGRPVVDELHKHDIAVRVIVRDGSDSGFPAGTDVRIGDISDEATFEGALDDIDAVIFTHGANGTAAEHEAVDYGAVKHVLKAGHADLHIALMTAIGVTDRTIFYNQGSEFCDWKRRSERLVRASGLPYTIVRPSWFDCNAPDEHRVVFQQGDRHTTGTPDDGRIARQQIAEVLVGSLFTPQARFKTFELLAEQGEALTDLAPSFAALEADTTGDIDGIYDRDTQPESQEPERFLTDLDSLRNAR